MTRPEPTKSGILGLIAAAQGRRRTDPIEDLTQLFFGVRVDQPGKLIRDFHTAHSGRDSMPLSYRYYLGDAVFLAGIEGDRNLLEGMADAIVSPAFPLYLGRRSCPPGGGLLLGVRDGRLEEVMTREPWHASRAQQRSTWASHAHLEFYRDARSPDEVGETVRDVPVNFSQERREYGWRTVVRDQPVAVDNPEYREPHVRIETTSPSLTSVPPTHDVLAAVGGI